MLTEAFGPAEVRKDNVTFIDSDRRKVNEIINKIWDELHLKPENLGSSDQRIYEAIISKESLTSKDHQAATVGMKTKINTEIKGAVRQEFFEKGWQEVTIKELKDKLEITLVEHS